MSKSPNYMSRNGWKPDMIVLHVAEGSFSGTVSWCCNKNSGVSCHYVSGKNGEIENLVDLNKAAWCNGTSTVKGAKYDYRRSTNRLVRERKTNANYYTISIENEGYSYKDGYGKLTDKQYAAVLKLLKELITKYNIPVDREHIVGHYEIAPKEKPNCPGSKFQWNKLMNDLTAWKNGSTATTTVTKEKKVTPYTVKINSDDGFLNVRAGAGMSYKVKQTIKNGGIYTIVAENGEWGKLKSGAGYIYLPLTEKVKQHTTKYYSACASKYKSIVDALNSINVKSSYSNRAKIAKANGIKGYIGSPSQNTKMLNLLKQGKLIKA